MKYIITITIILMSVVALYFVFNPVNNEVVINNSINNITNPLPEVDNRVVSTSTINHSENTTSTIPSNVINFEGFTDYDKLYEGADMPGDANYYKP